MKNIRNAPPHETTAEKDLGVLIDNELKFSKHIRSKVSQANRLIGLIKISFESLDDIRNMRKDW